MVKSVPLGTLRSFALRAQHPTKKHQRSHTQLTSPPFFDSTFLISWTACHFHHSRLNQTTYALPSRSQFVQFGRMNHVRIFLPVLPVFLGATPPSVWTADKFYTWLQEYYPSILAGAKFTPGAFFEAWTGALAVQLAEVPEGKNRTLIAKARMGELQVSLFSGWCP